MTETKAKNWKTTADMMAMLKVTKPVVATWRAKEGFPPRAVKVIDGKMYFDVDALKKWLLKWPKPKRGRTPSWFVTIGHKAAA